MTPDDYFELLGWLRDLPEGAMIHLTADRSRDHTRIVEGRVVDEGPGEEFKARKMRASELLALFEWED